MENNIKIGDSVKFTMDDYFLTDDIGFVKEIYMNRYSEARYVVFATKNNTTIIVSSNDIEKV
jgi:hypothetical protein